MVNETVAMDPSLRKTRFRELQIKCFVWYVRILLPFSIYSAMSVAFLGAKTIVESLYAAFLVVGSFGGSAVCLFLICRTSFRRRPRGLQYQIVFWTIGGVLAAGFQVMFIIANLSLPIGNGPTRSAKQPLVIKDFTFICFRLLFCFYVYWFSRRPLRPNYFQKFRRNTSISFIKDIGKRWLLFGWLLVVILAHLLVC